jgi:hypothetical protein
VDPVHVIALANRALATPAAGSNATSRPPRPQARSPLPHPPGPDPGSRTPQPAGLGAARSGAGGRRPPRRGARRLAGQLTGSPGSVGLVNLPILTTPVPRPTPLSLPAQLRSAGLSRPFVELAGDVVELDRGATGPVARLPPPAPGPHLPGPAAAICDTTECQRQASPRSCRTAVHSGPRRRLTWTHPPLRARATGGRNR